MQITENVTAQKMSNVIEKLKLLTSKNVETYPMSYAKNGTPVHKIFVYDEVRKAYFIGDGVWTDEFTPNGTDYNTALLPSQQTDEHDGMSKCNLAYRSGTKGADGKKRTNLNGLTVFDKDFVKHINSLGLFHKATNFGFHELYELHIYSWLKMSDNPQTEFKVPNLSF